MYFHDIKLLGLKKEKRSKSINSPGIKRAIGGTERSTFGPEKDATRTIEIPLRMDGRTYTDVDVRRTDYKASKPKKR